MAQIQSTNKKASPWTLAKNDMRKPPRRRRDHRTEALIRTLKQNARLTKATIRPKHLAYLNRWQSRLGLRHRRFTVYTFPYDQRTLARIHLFVADDHHVLGLSTITLKSSDWRNSVVHELLHAVFAECMKARRNLPPKGEEAIVEQLSSVLARGSRNVRS